MASILPRWSIASAVSFLSPFETRRVKVAIPNVGREATMRLLNDETCVVDLGAWLALRWAAGDVVLYGNDEETWESLHALAVALSTRVGWTSGLHPTVTWLLFGTRDKRRDVVDVVAKEFVAEVRRERVREHKTLSTRRALEAASRLSEAGVWVEEVVRWAIAEEEVVARAKKGWVRGLARSLSNRKMASTVVEKVERMHRPNSSRTEPRWRAQLLLHGSAFFADKQVKVDADDTHGFGALAAVDSARQALAILRPLYRKHATVFTVVDPAGKEKTAPAHCDEAPHVHSLVTASVDDQLVEALVAYGRATAVVGDRLARGAISNKARRYVFGARAKRIDFLESPAAAFDESANSFNEAIGIVELNDDPRRLSELRAGRAATWVAHVRYLALLCDPRIFAVVGSLGAKAAFQLIDAYDTFQSLGLRRTKEAAAMARSIAEVTALLARLFGGHDDATRAWWYRREADAIDAAIAAGDRLACTHDSVADTVLVDGKVRRPANLDFAEYVPRNSLQKLLL